MLTLLQPAEAYRRVELDARVAGSDGRALVLLCFERFNLALCSALAAADRADNAAMSAALISALAALTALELGIDRAQPLAAAFHQLYAGARKAVLDAATDFDPDQLLRVQSDFSEVSTALYSS